MPGGSSRQVLRQLSTLFHCGAAGSLSDEELLEQFVSGGEEAAEAAFAAVVDRHGAMVLGVCRRVLGNQHAAEDAFQATFLVLARKAAAIARRAQLASWLHGVASRAAMDARARAARQHAKEKRLGIMSPVERMDEIQMSELRSILDEELGRLPERHRAAIVLCELEGLSRREAARRLSVSEGTLSSRLARAKIRLRDRLTQRGLAFSAAALASALTHDAQALNVPPSLADSTIRGATLVATGSSLAGVASTAVITLTEGVLKAMLLSKLKLAFLGLVTVALVTTSADVVAQSPRASDEDRLKSVERKLDRLLEAIGGSRWRAPAMEPAPSEARPVTAAPAPAPAGGGMPGILPRIASVPQPPAQPATSPPRMGMPAAVPSPVMPAPAFVAGSHSLVGRVDMLEQRLANLERRLAEFERRLNGPTSGMPRPQPGSTVSGTLPPLPGSASTPAAGNVPLPPGAPLSVGDAPPSTALPAAANAPLAPQPPAEPPSAPIGFVPGGESVASSAPESPTTPPPPPR
jgi:RNA polymerase sigma factor (sigma-70 family)